MGRPSNTAERREQITAALLKVMAREGYEGASINEIASVAGLAPGLVHYHFKSKLEILLELVESILERQLGRLERRLEAAGEAPVARLRAFLDAHLALGSDADPEALACWIALSAEALRNARVRRRFEAALGALRKPLQQILADGVESGDFRCEDAAAAACALLAVIEGYYVLGATARALVPRGSAVASARRMAAGLLQCAELAR